MTPPTGYVEARRVAEGVVSIPDRTTPSGVFLPGSVIGQGDTAIIATEQVEADAAWEVVVTTTAPVTVPEPVKPKGKE